MPDEDRNLLNTILRRIPGFRGYAEQESRRDSDEKTRSLIADALQSSKRHLDEYARALVDAAKIDELPQCDKLRTAVDRVVARLRSSVPGYSGLFDAARVDEDRLEDVYDCDAWLLEEVDVLASDVEQLKGSKAEPAEVIAGLARKLEAIDAKIDGREKLLKELVSD